MKNTQTLVGDKARVAIRRGVNTIYDPVKRSIGPAGKSALLYRTYNRGSRMTDDGVSIAEVQEPRDPFVRLVSGAFKEMAKKTVDKVGDGTTTTTVIGGKLFNDVDKFLSESVSSMVVKASGNSAYEIRKSILKSAAHVKKEILAASTVVTTLADLEKIAIISAKDERIGKLVADMAFKVGVDGHIDVVEGYKGEIETEVNTGFRFQAKVPAKAFINNPKRYEMVATDAPVLLTNFGLDNAIEAAHVLSELNNQGIMKLVVIAPSFSDEVLKQMVLAIKQGYLIFPVAVPGMRTEQFEDAEVYFGARFINKNTGGRLNNVQKVDLGFAEKVIVKDTDMRDEAVATGGKGMTEEMLKIGDNTSLSNRVQQRVAVLKEQLKEQKADAYKKLMQRRIAALGSAVGVIRVGDSTDATALFWKLKIDDCVYACKAALRGGYVKGGGLCLKEIAETLPEGDILRAALCHPYELIQASVPGGIEIGDDVIDPTDAIFWSVEHATQIVAQLIMVDVLTPEIEEAGIGEGYEMLAKMVGEMVVTMKLHLGQIKENEAEMERDRLGGMTSGEKIMLDQG